MKRLVLFQQMQRFGKRFQTNGDSQKACNKIRYFNQFSNQDHIRFLTENSLENTLIKAGYLNKMQNKSCQNYDNLPLKCKNFVHLRS